MSYLDRLGLGWQRDAACAGQELTRFFPPTGGPPPPSSRRTCQDCPVRETCLAWALSMERGLLRMHRAGLYGGLSPTQRWKADPDAQEQYARALASRTDAQRQQIEQARLANRSAGAPSALAGGRG